MLKSIVIRTLQTIGRETGHAQTISKVLTRPHSNFQLYNNTKYFNPRKSFYSSSPSSSSTTTTTSGEQQQQQPTRPCLIRPIPPSASYGDDPLSCRDHAVISCFDLYSIGIGPSSSHTVGPMRAAQKWATSEESGLHLANVRYVSVVLYGSLAATGEGHGTPGAILAGLEGQLPATVDTTTIQDRRSRIEREAAFVHPSGRTIGFLGIDFQPQKFLPGHSNAMRFSTFDSNHNLLSSQLWYSVGGGFIVKEGEDPTKSSVVNLPMPLPFRNAKELLEICHYNNMSIPEVVMANETHRRTEDEVKQGILNIWRVMNDSILRGCRSQEPFLPGPLKVRRRAPQIYTHLSTLGDSLDDSSLVLERSASGPDSRLDWLSMYAMAVNEENAAGSRMVTAPTNGAAGVIPAVLKYYRKFHMISASQADFEKAVIEYLMTAAAIGMLAKKNASISAAEAGCQAEIGVASSMAAAGLVHLYGGSPVQCEAAAEIAMEHSLGLSCDPVGGLVQIPCIERNSIGALKALGGARLALHVVNHEDRRVTLDQALQTMKLTGIDMSTRYKETSTGGLSVVVPLC